jgi:hypothetical protein
MDFSTRSWSHVEIRFCLCSSLLFATPRHKKKPTKKRHRPSEDFEEMPGEKRLRGEKRQIVNFISWLNAYHHGEPAMQELDRQRSRCLSMLKHLRDSLQCSLHTLWWCSTASCCNAKRT